MYLWNQKTLQKLYSQINTYLKQMSYINILKLLKNIYLTCLTERHQKQKLLAANFTNTYFVKIIRIRIDHKNI